LNKKCLLFESPEEFLPKLQNVRSRNDVYKQFMNNLSTFFGGNAEKIVKENGLTNKVNLIVDLSVFPVRSGWH